MSGVIAGYGGRGKASGIEGEEGCGGATLALSRAGSWHGHAAARRCALEALARDGPTR